MLSARLRAGFGVAISASALVVVFAPSHSVAAIVGGSGTGAITFHSTFFADGAIMPSHTTGVVPFPGTLTHEAFAPGGAEHSYMKMAWGFSSTDANVFIPGPTSMADATRLELVPSPPNPVHHAATMTGTFEITYDLDATGFTTTIPARSYTILSHLSTIPGSPAAAGFEAHWDYTDVGHGLLGSQDIDFDASPGFGTVTTVASLPLVISIPAGHTALKVSGFFKLSAASDDFLGAAPPYDTLIALIPEPSGFILATVSGAALIVLRRRRLIGRS